MWQDDEVRQARSEAHGLRRGLHTLFSLFPLLLRREIRAFDAGLVRGEAAVLSLCGGVEHRRQRLEVHRNATGDGRGGPA